MRPILFELGIIQMPSCPLMICLGAFLAVWLVLKEVDRLKLDRGLYLKISLIAFGSGIGGARIMNCIVFWNLYRDKPWWKMLAIWEGGLAMYGGFILALFLCGLYIRSKGLSFWRVCDVLIPPWFMLLIAGRLGCFMNGCCYGKPTRVPWGFYSHKSASVSHLYATTHPTQLYSAAAALAIFLIMWRLRLRARFQGQVALVSLLLYPIARFAIEYFRADPRGMWRFFGLFTLSESQIISIPIFLFALVAWAVLSRHSSTPKA